MVAVAQDPRGVVGRAAVVAERELLQTHDVVTRLGQVPRGRAAQRTQPHHDVPDALDGHEPPSSRGTNQRRMSALSSSIGANQPCV